MNISRKISIILLVFILLSSITAFSVSANAPMPANRLVVNITNLPKEAVYADLLIQIPKEDSNYVDFQSSVYGADKSLVKEICDYSKDGYRSFTLHYRYAKSDIVIEHMYDEFYAVEFCKYAENIGYLTQYEDLINNYRNIKIVLLDKDFKIISVSNTVKLPKQRVAVIFNGNIQYDALENDFQVDTWINPYFVLFGVIFSIIVMWISIGTEMLFAWVVQFKRKQLFTIFVVNICSQLIMRTLYLVLPFPYLIETVIFETLVYISEFLIYKKRFTDVKKGVILAYTIIANTCSLLFGIFLNSYMLG